MALLENIKEEITKSGGRIAMGHLIVNQSPEWFNPTTKRYFNERQRWNENRRLRQGKKYRKGLWSVEDVQFVLDNFGTLKTSRICAIINRSPAAVRLKFGEVATPEQKRVASERTNKSRRNTNFKYVAA